MVGRKPRANTTTPRFRTLPWHDTHPSKLDLEQRLGPDHLARTIDAAVARLDLASLRAAYHGTGSAAHPPERLLGVVLYEMRRGRHSPAEWHHDARECEPVRWLLRGAKVARTCWYTFPDRIGSLLSGWHQQVLTQAIAAELTPATRAAEDGTLVAANASRHKLLNQDTLQRRAEQLAAAVAADEPSTTGQDAAAAAAPVALADAATPGPSVTPTRDSPPPTTGAAPSASPSRPAWMASTPAGRKQQQQRLGQAQRRMEELHDRNNKKWKSKRKAAADIVLSPSDPEAVVARDKEKVYRPLYNVQFVDDLDSPLILGYGVFAQQNDGGVLATMLPRVQQDVGGRLRVLLTDGGFAGGADLAAAEEAQVTVYAPVPGDGVEEPKLIPKKEFRWQAAEQTYVCPQGHRLEFEESWREKRADGGIQVWRYRCPPAHCQGCPLQARCTTTPASGRAVTRQQHEELIEALRARMAQPEAQALYRLRKQTVELVNADMKQHRKLRRFSGRGLTRVRCEVGMMVLAHNLLTLVNAATKTKAKRTAVAAANGQLGRT